MKKNKIKEKVEKKVVSIFKKLLKNDKLMKELAISTKAFSKLNGKEMQVLLNHLKRKEDNTRFFTMQEVFDNIYYVDKEMKRLNKFEKKYKKLKDKSQERYFRRAILTIGINVKNNIIKMLEEKLRKKYGFWKVKNGKKD